MKKKTEKKYYISMRGFLLSTIILLLLVVIALLSAFTVHTIVRGEAKGLIDSTMEDAQGLSDELSNLNIEKALANQGISYEINEMAKLNQGRVIVVRRDYQVKKDTFSTKEDDSEKDCGTYIISREVMDVMTGKKENISYIRSGVATVMLPIINSEGQIKGVIISTASNKKIEKVYKQIFFKLPFYVAGIFILAVIAAVFIAKISVKDTIRITKQIRQASDGNFDSKIDEKGFRETRYLVRNYNAVLSKLASADQSRQEFVSNVSHELKTPITSMKILAESLLQNENSTAEEYKEFMSDIVAEIDRETTTINDLLILVKTDKQNTIMNFKNADINELIDVILKRVTPLAENRGIRLTYESYKDVKADVDSVKFSIAISNLVENAVKYNVDNGWIKISLNADHKYFYVKVADSGVGIPDDAKDKVFDKFYRVDKARSRDTGGTGLGLSISRNVVNAHGGTIRLYSESGKGTTFTVRIPLKHETHVDKTQVTKKKKTNASTVVLTSLLMAFCMGLTGCGNSSKIKNTISEGLEEDIRSSDGNQIKIYYTDGESLLSNEEKYALKQPDNVAGSVEEVIAQTPIPDCLSYSGYTMTENNTVVLQLEAKDNISTEELLLNKAALVSSLSQIKNIGDIVITVTYTDGGQVEKNTYTDASFYYYGN